MKVFVVLTASVVLGAAGSALGTNMILNGSFENNSAGGTLYNLSNAGFNAVMSNATAWGAAEEIDVMENTTNSFGLPAVDGVYKLGLHLRADGAFDAFSFDLSSPIVAGQQYRLEFYAHAVLDFDSGATPLLIGISSSPTSAGTQIFSTGALSPTGWTHYGHDFIAPVGGAYLTVFSAAGTNTWAHVDNFSLVPTPGAAGLLALAGLAALRRRR